MAAMTLDETLEKLSGKNETPSVFDIALTAKAGLSDYNLNLTKAFFLAVLKPEEKHHGEREVLDSIIDFSIVVGYPTADDDSSVFFLVSIDRSSSLKPEESTRELQLDGIGKVRDVFSLTEICDMYNAVSESIPFSEHPLSPIVNETSERLIRENIDTVDKYPKGRLSTSLLSPLPLAFSDVEHAEMSHSMFVDVDRSLSRQLPFVASEVPELPSFHSSGFRPIPRAAQWGDRLMWEVECHIPQESKRAGAIVILMHEGEEGIPLRIIAEWIAPTRTDGTLRSVDSWYDKLIAALELLGSVRVRTEAASYHRYFIPVLPPECYVSADRSRIASTFRVPICVQMLPTERGSGAQIDRFALREAGKSSPLQHKAMLKLAFFFDKQDRGFGGKHVNDERRASVFESQRSHLMPVLSQYDLTAFCYDHMELQNLSPSKMSKRWQKAKSALLEMQEKKWLYIDATHSSNTERSPHWRLYRHPDTTTINSRLDPAK